MNEKIQLGEFQNVDSVNVDLSKKISLQRSANVINEFDINNVLDVTEVFDDERQNVDTYRVYGSLEYHSVFNGMPTDYIDLEDFFKQAPSGSTTKDIFTDFDFYLVVPNTGFTLVSTSNQYYVRDYTVLSKVNEFEIYNAGYDRNIFNEQKYAFNFNTDFDVTDLLDGLNFPLTDLYLYAVYQPGINGNNKEESMQRKEFNSSAGNSRVDFTATTNINVGDVIYGDLIQYDKNNFKQILIDRQEYYIATPYTILNFFLKWKYNPFIPIQIKVFSNELERVNTGSTEFEITSTIPSYATSIDNEGNVVWRNLLDKGFIDPLTGDGVNYPFVNQRHYLFDNIILSITPDLTDILTLGVFNEITFDDNTLISNEPVGDLNDLGKLC